MDCANYYDRRRTIIMLLENKFRKIEQWIGRNLIGWMKLSLRNKWLLTIINSFFPLLIGLLIYVFFIPTSYISKNIYILVGTSVAIKNIDLTGSFITCYLADFLWAYALMAIVMLLTVENYRGVYVAFGIDFLFEILMESLQKTPLIYGTFDIKDICVEFMANIIAFMAVILEHNFWRGVH